MKEPSQWQSRTLESLKDGEVFKFINEQPCLGYGKTEKQLLYRNDGVVYRYTNGQTVGVFNKSEPINKFVGNEDELPGLVR
jgi:hypothetical protein